MNAMHRTCLSCFVVLALLAVSQSAPAKQTKIDDDLAEMFSLIQSLSDTANELQESLVERQNDESTTSEPQPLPEKSEEVYTEERDRWNQPKPEITAENINEVPAYEKQMPELSRRCKERYCKSGRPPIEDGPPEDSRSRVDEILRALLMLREMETHEEKRDHDIPFP